MKNKKLGLLVVAFLAVFMMPIFANAQEKVAIYFFRGDGCPHCAEAEEFFAKLKEDNEYKDKFEIKDYEVWYSKENQKLAEKVAKAMGETLGGVPYIVIGEKTWNGYTETYGEEIKTQITELYNQGEYHDPVKDVLEGKTSNSNITIIIIGIVFVVVLVGLHFARKDSEEIPVVEEEELEEVETVKEETDEKVTETYKPQAKTTSQKTTNAKKKTAKKKNKR